MDFYKSKLESHLIENHPDFIAHARSSAELESFLEQRVAEARQVFASLSEKEGIEDATEEALKVLFAGFEFSRFRYCQVLITGNPVYDRLDDAEKMRLVVRFINEHEKYFRDQSEIHSGANDSEIEKMLIAYIERQ